MSLKTTLRHVAGAAGPGGLSLYACAAAVCLAWPAPAAEASYGFASFSAVVTPRGSIARSVGVRKSSNTGVGKYLIEFMRPIDTCAHVAGPHGTAGGQASVQQVAGQPTKVQVSTFNKAGVAANAAFVVMVSCSS